MAVLKKKADKAAPPDTGNAPEPVGDTLNPRQELFCRYYAQGEGTFGNATLSYAAAYEIDLGDLSQRDKLGNVIVPRDTIPVYNTCSANGSRLLRHDKVQARVTVLLNELLKDEIVDAELAKVIKQDGDLTPKVAAIKEFNKLRGRIIDKTKIITEKFSMDDIRALLAPLPPERQDEIYAILTTAIADAELLGSSAQGKGSDTQ